MREFLKEYSTPSYIIWFFLTLTLTLNEDFFSLEWLFKYTIVMLFCVLFLVALYFRDQRFDRLSRLNKIAEKLAQEILEQKDEHKLKQSSLDEDFFKKLEEYKSLGLESKKFKNL